MTGIVEENSRPGSPETEWDVNGPGDLTIQGFATEMSVNHGSPISFKVDTEASAYRIDIYRIGFYGGLGARLVTSLPPSVKPPQRQPPCLEDASTRLCDCGNWSVSATWDVPADAQSGVYIARLTRTDRPRRAAREAPPAQPHQYGALGHGRLANPLKEPRASHVVFVVRADESTADIVFQTADQSWHAFNRYGGSSLDGGYASGKELGFSHRASKASYNRPLTSRSGYAASQFFYAEYPMVRWLEANGYAVTYISGLDTARLGESLKRHKVFLTCGVDSYWTGDQRRSVEAALDGGVSLALFSGAAMFWRARWEASRDASCAPDRTLVCDKESRLDPNRDEWTGTFRDPPHGSEGERPENALSGLLGTVGGLRHDIIEVPAALGRHRFWRHTTVSQLEAGATALLEGAALGPHWDEDVDNGFRPRGLQHLSETAFSHVPRLDGTGLTTHAGPATHHLTLYRAASGGLVFSARTAQWSCGLDAQTGRAHV